VDAVKATIETPEDNLPKAETPEKKKTAAVKKPVAKKK